MKRLLTVTAMTVIVLAVSGQKADFQAAEKYSNATLSGKIGDLNVDPNWIEETDLFWYSYKTSSGKNFYLVDASKKNKQQLFDNRYMAAQLHLLTHKPYNELDLPIKELKFEKKSTSKFTFQIDSIKYLYDIGTRLLVIKDTIKKGEDKKPRWPNYSPDSTWIAYAMNYNLYLMKRNDKDSVAIQLTTDGERYFSYAWNSNDTAKNKKQPCRARWFKNSKKLITEREDERKVLDLFVINSLSNPRPKLETYRYAMPGDEFVPEKHLSVIDVASHDRVDINLNKWKDQTFDVYWSSQKAADKLIVVRKDRP